MLLMGAVVVLLACGSSSPGAATSISHSPSVASSAASSGAGSGSTALATSLTVITRAQAGAALGQPVTAPALGHATVEGGQAAVFYGPNAPSGASANVPVYDSVRVVLVSGPKAVNYFDDYRSKVKAQTIAGLGDRAYWDGYASLSVLEGDEYLRVAVIGVRNVLAAEEKLARDALPRM
jgi:hypothetical protein